MNYEFGLNKSLLVLIFAGLVLFPTAKTTAQGPPTTEAKLNPQLTACLKEKMGGAVFDEIKSGSRAPSEIEKKAGEECFTKYGQDLMKNRSKEEKRNLDFSPETDKCLQKKLGANYKDKLKNAQSRQEGEALMSQTKDCFGRKGAPVGSEDDEKKQLPDNVRSCIVNTIGQAEADKIFSGQKPAEGSDQFNQLEGAGCFTGFNKERRGEGKDLPPNKKQCIESVIGKIDTQPSEAQRQEIGKKCFNDKKPREGSEGDRPNLPKEIENCLQGALGNSFKEKPLEELSQSDREKTESCFRNNNFRPQGGKPGEQRPMNNETQNCVERVSGKSAESPEFDEETKQKVGKECFGVRNFEENKPQIPKSQDSIDCENKIKAENNGQLDDKRVNECFKGEHFGEPPKNGDRGGAPPNTGAPPPKKGENFQFQQPPSNDEPHDNDEKFCQENPSACQNKPPM